MCRASPCPRGGDRSSEEGFMSKRKPVSSTLAKRVRQIIIDHFPAYTRDANGKPLTEERELPVLRKPNTGWGEHYTIAWEDGAPYEWPILVTLGGVSEFTGKSFEPATFPPGVYVEPINGIELGIYPPHE